MTSSTVIGFSARWDAVAWGRRERRSTIRLLLDRIREPRRYLADAGHSPVCALISFDDHTERGLEISQTRRQTNATKSNKIH